MLEIDIADDGDFKRSGEQVNIDYAGARAVRAGTYSFTKPVGAGTTLSKQPGR